MAKVFKNSMVAHVWAQQNQASGRSNNGNFYFDGTTIYSYGSHFPIAKFITRGDKRCVLFTTRSYSISTGQHCGRARGAIPAGVPVFAVWDPTSSDYAAMWQELAKAVPVAVESFSKSTPWNLKCALRDIRDRVDAANEFRAFFGLRGKRIAYPVIPADVFAKVESRMEKKAAREAVKAEKRRVQNAAQEAKYRAEFREGAHHECRDNGWGMGAVMTDDDRAAHDVAYPTRMERFISVWRSGGEPAWSYGERPSETLMRVRGDVIETSHGAEFPIEHGVKAFEMIAKCRAEGRTFKTNGHMVHLGHFHIDEIEPDGTVRAGCHVVHWNEIEACARQLGIVS